MKKALAMLTIMVLLLTACTSNNDKPVSDSDSEGSAALELSKAPSEITAKERVGSKFNPLEQGERIDLITRDILNETVYYIHITLKEVTSSKAVFTIGVDDIVNGTEPLAIYTFTEEDTWNEMYSDLWFRGDEDAVSLSGAYSKELSADKEYTIGYGKEKDVTIPFGKDVNYIGIRTFNSYEIIGESRKDYDICENHDGIDYYYYMTAFKVR